MLLGVGNYDYRRFCRQEIKVVPQFMIFGRLTYMTQIPKALSRFWIP